MARWLDGGINGSIDVARWLGANGGCLQPRCLDARLDADLDDKLDAGSMRGSMQARCRLDASRPGLRRTRTRAFLFSAAGGRREEHYMYTTKGAAVVGRRKEVLVHVEVEHCRLGAHCWWGGGAVRGAGAWESDGRRVLSVSVCVGGGGVGGRRGVVDVSEAGAARAGVERPDDCEGKARLQTTSSMAR